MKIAVLDAFHLNPGDLSWEKIESLGEVIIYDRTQPEDLIERARGANIVLANKVILDEAIINNLPDLKCICVTATGFNNIDIDAAKKKGIVVCNVKDYGTNSVAQHVFAGILAVLNRVEQYSHEVREGVWTEKNDWSYSNETIHNLEGLNLGIIGFGQIGRKVAEIGQAFQMNILAVHRHPERDRRDGVRFVSLPELLETSDVISLHVPLNSSTNELINADTLGQMKSNAILVNTGRGGLVNENDLKEALITGEIRAAVLDVLNSEPPTKDNPLVNLQNCYITPHVAWAGNKARFRMMNMLYDNIKGFISGNIINQVN